MAIEGFKGSGPLKDGGDGQDGNDPRVHLYGPRRLQRNKTPPKKMGEMDKMGGMVLDGHGLDWEASGARTHR